jgi:hypothetical protein
LKKSSCQNPVVNIRQQFSGQVGFYTFQDYKNFDSICEVRYYCTVQLLCCTYYSSLLVRNVHCNHNRLNACCNVELRSILRQLLECCQGHVMQWFQVIRLNKHKSPRQYLKHGAWHTNASCSVLIISFPWLSFEFIAAVPKRIEHFWPIILSFHKICLSLLPMAKEMCH